MIFGDRSERYAPFPPRSLNIGGQGKDTGIYDRRDSFPYCTGAYRTGRGGERGGKGSSYICPLFARSPGALLLSEQTFEYYRTYFRFNLRGNIFIQQQRLLDQNVERLGK